MQATIWTLLPPIIAIALALITKEVYSSLLIGILSGALLYTGFSPLSAVETTFSIMGEKIGGNVNILIFLVLLGILVALVTKSGASRAYGEWASRRITSRRGALLATSALGVLIFVDDYFNCLTVGTVMRPVTDKYKVSRAKLAYIIDATAAPICIIAPISSWAAAVGSSMPEGSEIDGFNLFLRTIPFNLYALLTLGFIVWLMVWDKDIFAMKEYQKKLGAKSDSLNTETHVVGGMGKVKDLIVAILFLIVSGIAAMMYTGGILESGNIVDALSLIPI
ncbi:MAG: Na+/H+ antiporter NhaC family protein, partial [Eubacteriales bacterium]|nr:Na+/H+ antiporter NhaC family protein [Eubacteriales bacterium]